MITKDELLDIAKIKDMNNIGYVEKDYLLELALFLISKNTKDELVFKGGTAMYKFYKYARFSEDIDFSEIKTINVNLLIRKIVAGLKRFGIETEVKKIREPFNSILIRLRTKGPLYTGKPQTLSSIRIDINRKSTVELKPAYLRLGTLYTEIPVFHVLVMQEKEIVAEKIRAIITRNKARDVSDLFALIEKGIEMDIALVNRKMDYYNLRFSRKIFTNALNNKEGLWIKELKPMVKVLPRFKDVKRKILSCIQNACVGN